MQEKNSKFNGLQILNNKSIEILEIASFYYELCDIDNGTIHHKLFCILYIEKTYDNFDELSQRFGMDIRTLYNYRRKYEEFVNKLIALSQIREI